MTKSKERVIGTEKQPTLSSNLRLIATTFLTHPALDSFTDPGSRIASPALLWSLQQQPCPRRRRSITTLCQSRWAINRSPNWLASVRYWASDWMLKALTRFVWLIHFVLCVANLLFICHSTGIRDSGPVSCAKEESGAVRGVAEGDVSGECETGERLLQLPDRMVWPVPVILSSRTSSTHNSQLLFLLLQII